MELEAGRRFDYAVVNDDLDACVADVRRILDAERAGQVALLREQFDPAIGLARLGRA